MGYYIRADMADISVKLDGVAIGPNPGWATYEGGEREADDQKTRPGGMADQVAIGGPTSRNDVTVTTQFTDAVAAIAKQIEKRSGRGTFEVSVTYLNMNGDPVAAHSFIRTGIVKSVSIPNIDVNTGDVAFLTVVGSMNEIAN